LRLVDGLNPQQQAALIAELQRRLSPNRTRSK
jgi:hypothetical protein